MLLPTFNGRVNFAPNLVTRRRESLGVRQKYSLRAAGPSLSVPCIEIPSGRKGFTIPWGESSSPIAGWSYRKLQSATPTAAACVDAICYHTGQATIRSISPYRERQIPCKGKHYSGSLSLPRGRFRRPKNSGLSNPSPCPPISLCVGKRLHSKRNFSSLLDFRRIFGTITSMIRRGS